MSAEKDGNEEELKFTVALRPRHKLILESFKIVEGSQKQVVWKALEVYAKKYSSAIPGLYKKVQQEVMKDIHDSIAEKQKKEAEEQAQLHPPRPAQAAQLQKEEPPKPPRPPVPAPFTEEHYRAFLNIMKGSDPRHPFIFAKAHPEFLTERGTASSDIRALDSYCKEHPHG